MFYVRKHVLKEIEKYTELGYKVKSSYDPNKKMYGISLSKQEEREGIWRTIMGRRVFIPEGQDLGGAMQKSGKFEGIIKESDYKKQLTPVESKIEDAIKTSSSKYRLSNIEIEITGKGNLHIMTKDGRDIVTLDGSRFSYDDLEELRYGGYFKK